MLYPIRHTASATPLRKPCNVVTVVVDGIVRYFSDGAAKSATTVSGERIAIENGLTGVSPPRDEIDIAPKPGYRAGLSASVDLRLANESKSHDLIDHGAVAELAIWSPEVPWEDRRRVIGGQAVDAQWDFVAETCSFQIENKPLTDGAQIPSYRAGIARFAQFQDGWADNPYPLIYGSGTMTRRAIYPVDRTVTGGDPGAVTHIKYIVAEGHLPELSGVVLEALSEDAYWSVIPDNLYEIQYITDLKGVPVTLVKVEVHASAVEATAATELYLTASWTPRDDDTFGGMVNDILARSDAGAPLPADVGRLVDTLTGEVAFQAVFRDETTPLEAVADRLLPQVAATFAYSRGELTVWQIPRELTARGPRLRWGKEILQVESQPQRTPIDDIVNKITMTVGRREWADNVPSREKSRRDAFDDPDDDREIGIDKRDPNRNLGINFNAAIGIRRRHRASGAVYVKASTPAVAQASIGRYGMKLLHIQMPDLTDDADADGIAMRLVKFFAEPRLTVGYRLSIDMIGVLNVGDVVTVDDADRGLSGAPFIVQSLSERDTGPVVGLWGGVEIR